MVTFFQNTNPDLFNSRVSRRVRRPGIEVVVHPRSLHPTEAARAYNMRHEEHMKWEEIAESTSNLEGHRPSLKCVRNAVARVSAQCNFQSGTADRVG